MAACAYGYGGNEMTVPPIIGPVAPESRIEERKGLF